MEKVLILVFLCLPQIFGNEVTLGVNKFAGSVYKRLSKNVNENVLFSPFSAATLLAFLQSGAVGETAEEIRHGLHFPNQTQIEQSLKKLRTDLQDPSSDIPHSAFSFHSANGLYLAKTFNIKDNFKRVAADVFDAHVNSLDLAQSVKASKIINQWIEEHTENKIHDLVKPDSLNSDTAAILVNALYLKGNWSHPFKRAHTVKKVFHTNDLSAAMVDTMTKYDIHTTFNYAENKELKAKFLELPLAGDVLSMVFVLPFEQNGLSNLEYQAEKVFMPQNYTSDYVNMSIPKFKIESRVDFKKVLMKLQIESIFTRGAANFSGISDDSSLVVSDITQKTFLSVDEYGVEAAAATFAELATYSGHSVSEPKQFHANHPFIYFIKFKDLIMFAGRFVSPA